MPEKTGKGTVANLKDFITSIREGIIVVVLLLFLFLPKVMNGVLESAGFTSVNLAGFKWELEKSMNQTKEARDQVIELEQKLVTFDRQLRMINESPDIKAQDREKIARLSRNIGEAREKTSIVSSSLKDSLQVQRSIVEQADRRQRENPVGDSPTR